MTDHRRVQRALFRMQMDPAFAAAVLAREEAAVASIGLAEEDLALLLALDPVAVTADRGGKRRRQLLGNVADEYVATVAAAPDGARIPDGFLASPELHGAIAGDGRLPLAFGAWVRRRARELGRPELEGLAALESALALARREERAVPPAGPDEVVLAPRARLVELPSGTLAWASALRAALEAGRPLPPPPRASERETVLVVAGPRPSPWRLPEVRPERLEPEVAALLRRAERPLGPRGRARLARELGADPAELEEFAAELEREGVLLRGA